MSIFAVSNENNVCSEESFSAHLNAVESIRKAIEENNYSRAIDYILLLCDNQSLDFQVVEEVYSLLKDLIPLINEKEFAYLQGVIQKLLNLSPNFPDLQKGLAIQLASVYVNKGDISSKDEFSFYLQAMHYYAKALKIEEEHKKIEEEYNLKSDVHYLASQIFIKIIQLHNVNSEKIKHQLELAVMEGNSEKFGSNLKHIETLAKYLMAVQGNDVIKMYKQALEVFNNINPASKELFSPFFDTIQNGLFGEFSVGQLITKCCLEAFYRFRTFFNNEFNKISSTSNYKEVRVFQKKVTNKLQEFFRNHLLNNALAILGGPPCDCDLRAMGAAGREEICPYSDLEWMILISNNQNKDRINLDNDKINQEKEISDQHISFFRTLASFIELQVVSLGETSATDLPVFTSLGTKNSFGFHIDLGGNPAKDDLIGCPEKMASLQIPINQDQDYDPRSTSHTMLKTISLYQTTPDLFDQYQKNIDAILDKELLEEEKISALTVRERKALKLIEKRFADYKKTWNVYFEEHQVINIKEQYIEVLQHLISDLALFYGIKETNTLDIIESLKLRRVFTKESSALLKEAVSFIYMLRVRLHLEYKEQKEDVYINKQSKAYTKHQEAYSQPQNDLNLLHLRSNEIEKLAEIYWLVIRPIFFKISKSFNEFKKQFTKISLAETSLEESLWCEDESEAKKLIPLSKYLAIYYTRIKEHLEVHLNCYKRFSQKSIFEPLRVCYLKTLRKEKQFPIANTLSFIPNRNGLRRSHVEAYQKLQDSLRQITTNATSAVLIKSPTLQTPLYLKPEFVNQILDIDGNIKREYNNSLHRVCRLSNNSGIDLHFKQKPNHPLMEYAMHDLTSRLTGQETPSSELLRFEVTIEGKTKVYPVLVSQTVTGENLKEVLAKDSRYKPNPKCLTRMLLNAICIRPGDGKSSNFVVNNDQLFCIDNDIAFVEPIVRDRMSRNTNFCSILFCLENQLLDIEILQKFISIDIDLIFASWLEALVQKEKLYLPLFVKEEKQLYEEDTENRFTPTILLPAGMITTIYTQTHLLQQFLQDSINDQLLSIDLLDKLITLRREDGTTSHIGGRIYKQYKDARSLLSPEKRLKQATNRQAEQSLTTRQAMKASLGKTPTIEEIQKRKKFSLKQAQKEFMGYSLFRIEGGITRIRGERQMLSANFEKVAQSGNPDIERQNLMLRGLYLFFSYQKKKPISITLTNCAVLNTKKLSHFFHNELKYLDLRYSLVKGDMVETISSNCPNLQELYLSECDQLQAVENRKLIFSESLKFPQLEVFHIARCNNLEKLKINALKLRVLKANNNVKLKDINISESYSSLKELYLSGCNQIRALEDRDRKYLNFPQLEILHIARCENLERLKINTPKLQVLKANNDVNLKDLNILESCPNLKELYLSEYRQIQALEDNRRHRQPLNFPNLEVLHIARCDNLERLHIHAPKLRALKADNNAKLKEIVLTSPLAELNVDKCPLLTEVVFRNKDFGKKEWEKYFGDIGTEPPLPANIEEILNEPCSFWPDKKVKETHLLVLIPSIVNGKAFTMDYLEELIQKPKSGYSTKYRGYWASTKNVVGDKSYSSHWLLITSDIIPGSRGKRYSKCCELIANHRKKTGVPYELPHLLEATVSILVHYVKTGERLYSDDPCTYTNSQDVDKNNYPFCAGGFSARRPLCRLLPLQQARPRCCWLPEVLGFWFLE